MHASRYTDNVSIRGTGKLMGSDEGTANSDTLSGDIRAANIVL